MAKWGIGYVQVQVNVG